MMSSAMQPAERSVDTGVFVAVVGPSGAGKDSVLSYAQEKLADLGQFQFARRIVTRPALENAEEHDSMDEQAFAAALAAGQFALHWRAHGLSYALSKSVETHVQAGGVVIANLSRSLLDDVRSRFARVLVVHLTAQPHVLAQRLAARGRESASDIEARLQRVAVVEEAGDTVTIDNSGPLDVAGARFVGLLRKAGGITC